MKPDGGPAFPHPFGGGDGVATLGGARRPDPVGMTLRDYFAAAALGRCIQVAAQFIMEEPDFVPGTRGLSEVRDRATVLAYSIADAMLEERKA